MSLVKDEIEPEKKIVISKVEFSCDLIDPSIPKPLFQNYIQLSDLPGQCVRPFQTGFIGNHNRSEMAYIALLEACISLFVPDLNSKGIGEEIEKLKKSLVKQLASRRQPTAYKKMIQAANSKRNNNVKHNIGTKFLAYFA